MVLNVLSPPEVAGMGTLDLLNVRTRRRATHETQVAQSQCPDRRP